MGSSLADFNKDTRSTVTTRPYRAPEVILSMSYGKMIDIWSAGCLFFNLYCYEQLFLPQESEHFTIDEDHLAQILELRNNDEIEIQADNNFLKSAPKFKVFFLRQLHL